ncbi:MAG: class I SAM-dependent methyltransferase [Xanthobacteraceae bacterium]|nr:class I SAM-dependent methyltransferase [Xanthobacteraceae bacterium]
MPNERTKRFDPVWDEIYRSGQHANRYPWDAVVSFVFRYRPREKPPTDTSIIEVGCGTAPNLWFAAHEGFRVAGIDASEAAIVVAKARFAADGLRGDLWVGNFSDLPFDSETFDLAIDRAALTCVGDTVVRAAVAELHRVLRPGGLVFCNVYSDRHSSRASGRPGPDGITDGISAGTLVGVGQIRFYGRDDLSALFAAPRWTIVSLEHLAVTNAIDGTEHAEWRLIARKG